MASSGEGVSKGRHVDTSEREEKKILKKRGSLPARGNSAGIPRRRKGGKFENT